MVADRSARRANGAARARKIRLKRFLCPLQPFGACPQSVIPMRDTKGQGVFTMGKGMRHAIAWAIFLLAGVPAVRAQQPPAEGRDPNAPSAPQPIGDAARSDRKKTEEAGK